MRLSQRFALVLVPALMCATPLLAQDTGMMKKDTSAMGMKKDGMAMGTGMKKDGMMHDAMMSPSGTFSGQNRHAVSGGYSIAMAGSGSSIALNDAFTLDQAPDPYVVLSPTDKGDAKGAVNLGKLKSPDGASTYTIPAGTDLKAMTHVLIYSRKSNATLAQADLAVTGMMKSDGMMKPAGGMMSHDTGMHH